MATTGLSTSGGFMSSGSPNKLRSRVVDAAESALARQGYISAVDVLIGIGWLDPTTLQRWKQGQLSSLADGIQTKSARVADAMEALRNWAIEKQLHPSVTQYVARAPSRHMLRFSASGGRGDRALLPNALAFPRRIRDRT